MNLIDDTIVAISTPIGSSGIGIVRLSGSESFDIVNKIFKPRSGKQFNNYDDRKVIYGHIIDNYSNKLIDEVLVSKMYNPTTYTKEDIVEINCHGGMVPIKKILQLVIDNGARLAEPGEFTKKAFLNGRLDLAQAEAVMDIITSKTDKSMEISLSQLEGTISNKIINIRDILLSMMAHIEASIDYPEYDIEELSYKEILDNAIQVKEKINELLKNSQNGRIIREGIDTAIIGKPNVGKSSLLNALLGQSRAIVTEIPGTTRDTIEEYININGVALKLIDTAGIRQTENIIEKIGIEKTNKILEESELILLMLDASEPLSEDDINLLKIIKNKNSIVIINKIDINKSIDLNQIKQYGLKNIIEISALKGINIELLKDFILNTVCEEGFDFENYEIVTNVRHINLLNNAMKNIDDVIEATKMNMSLELLSIDINECWNNLGKITGDTVSEDLLDEIFSKFCIGK